MFRRSLAARAQWGANPADIQFTSWAKRDGNSSTFLASARQTQEYKPVNDQAARMALSVGSPDYFKNVGKDEELLHRNEKTGEINGYPGLEPTRYGDWEKGGRCIDF
eukprot:TRINITY_DN22325_c0_g1_i1.p1 TRINITY_DN22325_c0_g1~~TRINITY_DN22325_c0_g1_i1.p1  ORF type:complete len:107 (+),score=21.95 TRINITY_DN22325_c0_g1_i1:42-362(+)